MLEGGDLPQRAGLREGGRVAAEAVWRLSPRAVVRGPRGDQPDPRGAGRRLRTFRSTENAGKRFDQALKANLPAFDAGKAAADLAAHSKPQSSLRWPGESPRPQAQPPGEAEAGPSEATRQLAALNVSSQSVVNLLVSAAADYIVCTASSNWCRVVVKLGCALQGRCPRAVFMDEWEWDFTMQGRTAMREPSFRSFSQIQLRGGDPDLFFRDPW